MSKQNMTHKLTLAAILCGADDANSLATLCHMLHNSLGDETCAKIAYVCQSFCEEFGDVAKLNAKLDSM